MDLLLRIIPLALIASILVLLLNQHSRSIGVILTISCCIAICVLGLGLLEEIVDFLTQIRIDSEIDEGHTHSLLKAVGISVLVEFTCSICEDAGQSSVSKMVRLCGNCATILVSLPLMEAVLGLLEELLGG